jgi:hypothetical protein
MSETVCQPDVWADVPCMIQTPTRARRAGRLALTAAVLALAVGAPALARSLTNQADAGLVKAAFIINFLKFVDRPASEGTPRTALTVAVLGDDQFYAVLSRAAAGQSVQGRSVTVRAINQVRDAQDAHLIFIAGSQARNLPAILRDVDGRAVVTVGDTEGYAQAGVMLNLYTFDQRVRIEANATAAARAGVRLSSQLLRLARIVG